MQIYNYSPVTGEFLGSDIARESPLEPGVFLMPACATDVAPPQFGASEAAVFANGAWSVVPDYREQTWFDKVSGAPCQITALGLPPDSLSPTMPPDIAFEEAHIAQANKIANAFNAAVAAITSPYPGDERDSWPKQEAEARSYVANNTASTPLLSAIAAARGIAQSDLAARVITNADNFAGLAGAAIGRRQARMDAISAAVAAKDLTALQAIVW